MKKVTLKVLTGNWINDDHHRMIIHHSLLMDILAAYLTNSMKLPPTLSRRDLTVTDKGICLNVRNSTYAKTCV